MGKGAFFFVLASLALVFYFQPSAHAKDSLALIRSRGVMRWGADAGTGGAPYVFADPNNPKKLIGFETELAELISKELGVKSRHVQNDWDTLIPALERGDFDMIINGLEITPQREKRLLFSIPYYVYTLQLMVRNEEKEIKSPSQEDLKGHRVATLANSVAQFYLQKIPGVTVVLYTGIVEEYEDLKNRRVDAVFLDLPIAAYYGKPVKGIKYAGKPVGEGYYGIAFRKRDEALKAEIDRALHKIMTSGAWKEICERWGAWNRAQEALMRKAAQNNVPVDRPVEGSNLRAQVYASIPLLIKAAGMTIVISVSAMALAVVLGFVLAMMRVFGNSAVSSLATAYVEVMRGTPLLLQLYLIYFGLPHLGLTLNAFTAAVLGLGLNYAANEAENYRAGFLSIPKGQLEAALSLGMTHGLAVRRILFPQALRISLPPMTNDFIALFKDTSLVSTITVVELTKQYSILSNSAGTYIYLGVITALLYLIMSYPLSLLSRSLEKRLAPGHSIK